MSNLAPELLAKSLLPPNGKDSERAIEAAMRADVDLSAVGTLWNAQTCPAQILPFLAFGLAIARWDENWTEEEKRAEIANAIAFHKRKGTRGIVEEALERFHPMLQLVEWWEANPPREPYTFEVRAPAELIPASFLNAETVTAIIRDVASVMPVRCHFDFVQSLEAQAALFLAGGAVVGGYYRNEANAAHDESQSWSSFLQTEDGEPFQTEDGNAFLEDV